LAETQGEGAEHAGTERAPSAPELLRAAMEKVVFFEWRLSELAAELTAAQTRAAAAEAERDKAVELRGEAERQAFEARQHAHHLDSERDRLATLLTRPAQAVAEAAAVQTERARAVKLESELNEARREIERHRAERDRWLAERLAQAQGESDSEGSLAEFISELRGEVIALRDREKRCDDLLRSAGIDPPPPASRPPPIEAAPALPADPIEQARALLSQGRLSISARPAAVPPSTAAIIHAPTAAPVPSTRARSIAPPTLARRPAPSAAAIALAEQCMRGLSARDPARREQAARHLAAVPVAAAAPALASALGVETEPRARGQMAAALVACGGAAATDLVMGLQRDPEPLVRLAVLDALCSIPERATAALEIAASDESVAVRRRAAALAATLGMAEIRTRLAMDPDESVRAACAPREVAPAPTTQSRDAEAVRMRMSSPGAAAVRPVQVSPESGARDLAREAVLTIQTAIFGLTDTELAAALSVPEAVAGPLVARLISSGRLTRRGKRLIAAEAAGAAAQGGS
jgi:hypothetical protein